MTAGELLARASLLEQQARGEISPLVALRLRGEALVCRGLAWIQTAGETR